MIGVLPGSKPEWAGQSALLTAHYDHLGSGWPDVHKGDEGRLHQQYDVLDGLEQAPLALSRLFSGGNLGKQLVRL